MKKYKKMTIILPLLSLIFTVLSFIQIIMLINCSIDTFSASFPGLFIKAFGLIVVTAGIATRTKPVIAIGMGFVICSELVSLIICIIIGETVNSPLGFLFILLSELIYLIGMLLKSPASEVSFLEAGIGHLIGTILTGQISYQMLLALIYILTAFLEFNENKELK